MNLRRLQSRRLRSRRSLLQWMAMGTGAMVMTPLSSCDATQGIETNRTLQAATPQKPQAEHPMATSLPWRMPDEAEPHARTWMAFGANRDIWGTKLLAGVQNNLALIAQAIAQYEPVTLLVRETDYERAAQQCGDAVELVIAPLDDLWIRDTGPVFVRNTLANPADPLAAMDFNFNGWGEKQAYGNDAQVANLVAQQARVPRLQTSLVLEGGSIEVDGRGTAIITKSCTLNENRNPGLNRAAFEALLKPLLGLDKIIWLPGIRGHDITDGHTDFYARFASPGRVVAAYDPDPRSFDHAVTQKHLEILRSATDAEGRSLEVQVIEHPTTIRPRYSNQDFAAGYINFYVVNGAVIAPEFGDTKADANAKAILKDLFPQRDIIQLNIDAIAAGGGGIHCTTQQQPQA